MILLKHLTEKELLNHKIKKMYRQTKFETNRRNEKEEEEEEKKNNYLHVHYISNKYINYYMKRSQVFNC